MNKQASSKKKSSQLTTALVYAISFLVCLGIFGVIGYLAVRDFVPGAEAEETENYEEEQVTYSQSDSMTFLYTISNEQNELISIVVARFMPQSQQIIIVPLSPYTQYNGQTLGNIYSIMGAADLADQAGALLGITIDKYMTMTDSTFAEIVNLMGSSVVTLIDNVAIYDKGYDEYTYYNKGERLACDGDAAVQLLAYTEYPDGRSVNMKMSGEIASALINTFFSHTESAKNNIDSLFKKQYADANTNMSSDEYSQMKSAVIYVIENSSSPSYSLTPTGSWSEDGIFTMDDSFLEQLDAYFNNNI